MSFLKDYGIRLKKRELDELDDLMEEACNLGIFDFVVRFNDFLNRSGPIEINTEKRNVN